jgi:hypothetical protein
MTIFILVVIACSNKEGNDGSSTGQLDSILATLAVMDKDVIRGDSLCGKGIDNKPAYLNKFIFDKANQVDSLKELWSHSIGAKIIGKGKKCRNFQTFYALREWGDWYCTVELLVFNKKWELTGFEIIAGLGGDENESNLGICRFINCSRMEMTWTSKKMYFEEADPVGIIDSTIIETTVTGIKIDDKGTLSEETISYSKRKI